MSLGIQGQLGQQSKHLKILTLKIVKKKPFIFLSNIKFIIRNGGMIQSQYIIAQNNLREPSNVKITYTEVNHTLLLVTMTVTITSHYLKNGKSKEWTGNQARQSLQKNHCSIKM